MVEKKEVKEAVHFPTEPKAVKTKRSLSPELVATLKRDHELKVAKFLAGGKF